VVKGGRHGKTLLNSLAAHEDRMRLAICIGTFRRRGLLQVLLDGISRLTFCKVPRPEITIIVVDNDVNRSAETVCREARLSWPVKYFVEPRRGISFVRNRAIAEAGDVDFIATIDDDEVPSAEWLDELLWTQREFKADIVNGPVLPQYDDRVANWVKQGKFFVHANYLTGTRVTFCYTGNSLIRSEVFSDVPLFDNRFALTGGEDTHFFLRAQQAGYTIIWSREAITYEWISTARASAAWILRRQYQLGNCWAYCELSLDRRIHVRVIRLAKASAFIAIGSALTLCSAFLGKAATGRALQRVSRGLGMLTAMAGFRFRAYQPKSKEPAETHIQTGSQELSQSTVK
jgi:succinoglycan biosynthesis protein ExoM